MNESFGFTLHSPLTKEDWSKLLDAEHDHTTSVTFQTPQGKQVRYIKCEVLDKIKDEIKDNTYFINETTEKEGIDFETVEKIIDKYKAESEVKND